MRENGGGLVRPKDNVRVWEIGYGSSSAGVEGKRCPTLTEDRAKK